MSTQTVRNWEAGRTEPSIEHVRRLAIYYDVQLEIIDEAHRESPREVFGWRMRYNRVPVIATKLLAACEEARLTQGEAATRAGIGKSALGRYERGRANPTPDTLERLAKLYGRPADWFASMSPIIDSLHWPASGAVRERERSPVIQAYRDAQADLTEEAEEQIADFIRFIHARIKNRDASDEVFQDE